MSEDVKKREFDPLVSFRVSDNEIEVIKQLANDDSRSVSAWSKLVVLSYIKNVKNIEVES